MKKKLITLTVTGILASLSACTTTSPISQQTIGIANPASVYCATQGGKSIIKKDGSGAEAGFCQLPNGQLVDEWVLYRQANPL